jgi:heat-inducible transcriptional repressor
MDDRLSERSQILLKNLVERYIADGLPVGSKLLADNPDLPVSSATIRNLMADLEEQGFLRSPHTSAGRVPTDLGYRFFVDSLVDMRPLPELDVDVLGRSLDPDMSAHELVQSASGILSEYTRMAGLVTIPKRDQVLLRHVEFLRLNERRLLVILVLDDHEVQNRIIYTNEDYTDAQLKEASNFLNQSFIGKNMRSIRQRLVASMQSDQESMNQLMVRTLDIASQAFAEDEADDYVVAGQENLFEMGQQQALNDVRDLFRAFSVKADILHLLDRCLDTEGVKLFIGQESGYEVLDECTVVTSPYQVAGEIVGVLAVIGPTRMAYERVIPIVDATARVFSRALETSLK